MATNKPLTTYSDDFGKRICEALGLDPSHTQDITLHVPLEGFVTVAVRQVVDEHVGESLISELVEYNLVEADDG